jgi:hypothetical protein
VPRQQLNLYGSLLAILPTSRALPPILSGLGFQATWLTRQTCDDPSVRAKAETISAQTVAQMYLYNAFYYQ